MKRTLRNGYVIILLLSISFMVSGQYSGIHPDVAAGKIATSLDSIPGYEPSKAIDRMPETYCSLSGEVPVWIQVDLGQYHFMDGYGMDIPNVDELPLAYNVQGSLDGFFWVTIKTGVITEPGNFTSDLTYPGDYRYVRFEITDKDPLASVAEVYVFGYERVAPEPPLAQPASSIAYDGFTTHWSKRTGASGYLLSVATDINFFQKVDGYDKLDIGDNLEWDVEGLEPMTSYYYRVIAYNVAGESLPSNKVSVTTLKQPQTIMFSSLEPATYGDGKIILNATASSGLPVSFASSEQDVAVVDGDTLIIMGVGSTQITASQEGNDKWEAAESIVQSQEVTRKELTISNFTAKDKIYDGTLDATINTGTLDGVLDPDEVILEQDTNGIFAQPGIGTDIMVTYTPLSITGADTAKYTLIQPGSIGADIMPKELIVLAGDSEREECSDNPEFSYSVSGFIEGEDESVMTSEPTVNCLADPSSSAGEYPITASGGSADNYFLTYVDGTLTVVPDYTNPSLTVQDVTVYLDESGNGSLTPAEVVTSAEDNCGIVDTTLSKSEFTEDDPREVLIAVEVKDAAGNIASETLIVTVEQNTAIDLLSANEVKLYPNPTTDRIFLETQYPLDELKVLDITGKAIISMSALELNEVIDMTEFKNGIYLFQMKLGEYQMHMKVIKN
jgi:hypothetical protein